MRLTATHRPADDDHAGQVLCDADLGILAADPARYASYTAGVRREYAHVPDADFAAGRAAVLRDLLAKPTPVPHGRRPDAVGGAGARQRRARDRAADHRGGLNRQVGNQRPSLSVRTGAGSAAAGSHDGPGGGPGSATATASDVAG